MLRGQSGIRCNCHCHPAGVTTLCCLMAPSVPTNGALRRSNVISGERTKVRRNLRPTATLHCLVYSSDAHPTIDQKKRSASYRRFACRQASIMQRTVWVQGDSIPVATILVCETARKRQTQSTALILNGFAVLAHTSSEPWWAAAMSNPESLLRILSNC